MQAATLVGGRVRVTSPCSAPMSLRLWSGAAPTMGGRVLRRRSTSTDPTRGRLALPLVRALLKGLLGAEPWSLRGFLFASAFAILAVTIGFVATGAGSRNGIAGGLAGSAAVLVLALGAQWWAERRGAPERERRRREEWADQLLSWPRWKQIGVLTVAVAFAGIMLILSLLSAL